MIFLLLKLPKKFRRFAPIFVFANFSYKGGGLCKTRYKKTIFVVWNPSYFYVFKSLGFLMARCVSKKISRGFRFFGVSKGWRGKHIQCSQSFLGSFFVRNQENIFYIPFDSLRSILPRITMLLLLIKAVCPPKTH